MDLFLTQKNKKEEPFRNYLLGFLLQAFEDLGNEPEPGKFPPGVKPEPVVHDPFLRRETRNQNPNYGSPWNTYWQC